MRLRLRQWLVYLINVFILNLLQVRCLCIVWNSSWTASILGAWLLICDPDSATWSLLRWAALRISKCCLTPWLFFMKNIWLSIWCCFFRFGTCLATHVILLFKLRDNSFFNIAEMSMLQPSQLYELLRPNRLYIAVLPTSGCNRTGNEVVISIYELWILNTQQREEVNVLFK